MDKAKGSTTTTLSKQTDSICNSWQQLGCNSEQIFGNNWDADICYKGARYAAHYRVDEPSRGRAYFHMVLDASGSMFARCEGSVPCSSSCCSRKRTVYEHLFACFEDLVQCGGALRPDDMICVWAFNKGMKLLCEVETKNYPSKKDFIKQEYEKELNNCSINKLTHMYDAVATAMAMIRKTSETKRSADFFLVTFTDGMDTGTGTSKSIDNMIKTITDFVGRLHTFFITVNLPPNSELRKKLEAGRSNEIQLLACESTKPAEISQKFNSLRELIKAVLIYVIFKDGNSELNRITANGKSSDAIGGDIMKAFADNMKRSALLK